MPHSVSKELKRSLGRTRILAASALTVVLLFAAFSQSVLGQVRQLDRRLEDFRKQTRVRIDPNAAADERIFIDGGAFIGVNYLSVDDSSLENHVLRQYDFTAYGRISIDQGVHDLFFRGRASFRNFNEGDVFGDSDNNDWEEVVERAFYRFDLSRFLGAYGGEEPDTALRFKGGRDFVYWANGLTLAQTIDGAVVEVDSSAFTLQLLAGVTASDATVDIDTSRPEYNTDTDRGFFGVMAALKLNDHRPFAYFLAQRDYNDQELVLTTPAIPDLGNEGTIEPVVTKYDYNSYYLGIGSTGPLSDHLVYSLEAVAEFGSTLSNSFLIDDSGEAAAIRQAEQTEDDIRAYALDFLLDYAPPAELQPRLSLEFLLASGDDDRGHPTNTFDGNRSRSKDRSFNAFGLINTGLAFAPEVTNLVMVRAGGSVYPAPHIEAFNKLQVGIDLFAFGKFDKDAAIAEPTNDSRYLGFEPDLFLNWQISSDVSLAVRYGIFFPGEAIENDDRPRQFIFAGVTFAL